MPSSVVAWMRYEPRRRTLVLGFQSGRGVYRYFDVPPEEWARFRAAESKGTYLNTAFKDGGYGYERLVDTLPNSLPSLSEDAAYFWKGA